MKVAPLGYWEQRIVQRHKQQGLDALRFMVVGRLVSEGMPTTFDAASAIVNEWEQELVEGDGSPAAENPVGVLHGVG